MIICKPCKTEMECSKTGIVMRWHGTHCKRGDAYMCPSCGAESINVLYNTGSYHEDTPVEGEVYLDMEEVTHTD